ncbi:MAG: hypothetical protein UW46_C0007G0020 [Candidatus Yanofskybacteria bacterium GW2011_GWF1_44_227]|uniref:Uncharacterized protein n=1 Tax=Candidatus Yanofskybacteria bacterium GW2011_GWE2_40_11 TaxID=1619033 RepID=A0A0G0QRK2_9BACT|nr:MAG: hypothetical protein UT75_C0011G0019 [Candidatus Yanofskybacteria bacterium GW2011_GWE2_40_11]KKT15360.1 MAG: hypothetical protein UV97_C0008G0009 [Candidatus Yanofskybacteria bacterium GW2011_GWF2_43_596]KKT53044.1 MAG: hypothetical protein UW46_C0007G0020 [Candidatus Yanofskybacteria bacterium GW2011_GWF1_44_227]OGN35727.1 MAG: hypothetical protein A2241_02480 [Candidatus Yanofskybacteria bacterium RIFOXYA2_FULL_45_28]OGN35765.1 MAG: hypothetical protein A2207_01695 [Candidatus Yanofs
MTNLLSILFAIFLTLGLFKIATGYERHDYVDGKLMKAWHVSLPGYAGVYYPEQIIELQNWTDTHWDSLRVVDKGTGKDNPEATAGLALKAVGIYLDYELKQKEDGHWILFRPSKSERYFTWAAYYRVGSWRNAER